MDNLGNYALERIAQSEPSSPCNSTCRSPNGTTGRGMARTILRHERWAHDSGFDSGQFDRFVVARECASVTEVIASEGAHLSIAKAAHILGLKFRTVPINAIGSMDAAQLPSDLSKAALALTVGATSTGAIDPLGLAGRAAWTHVDAAWAGPLRMSKYAHLLAGIESADSVAVSAHKWLFQPKESALVLFKDTGKAHAAVSFGGAYLATPNVGVLGSHGATATTLLATLLACGGIKELRSALSTAWILHAACETLLLLTNGLSFMLSPKPALLSGVQKTRICLAIYCSSCLLVPRPQRRFRVVNGSAMWRLILVQILTSSWLTFTEL